MRDRAVIRHRLGQYSALWLGAFLLVLIIAAATSLVARLDLIDVADLVLPVAFVLLGGAMLYGVGATAVSRAGPGTKSLIVALALLLILPLLWAPVLAVLVVAAIGGVVIEYSTTYAHFRIAVSQVVYPLVALFTDSPLAGAVWAIFQVAASVVGFLASATQVVKTLRGLLVGDGDGDVEAA
ncbi:hypothetical protein ASD79_05695 [Caulobacter sp. Root655]|uniref:hypothetical protein n=1 Tax=Caulobacter sp. Root655 TaxID=1736578 RepID=UPI0006FB308A|nr:hypothetical protein [Caulobacter sp. Root655]KRA61608.1 hypothetical protein ASD79_05695 [Caulobacter sp. Root655]